MTSGTKVLGRVALDFTTSEWRDVSLFFAVPARTPLINVSVIPAKGNARPRSFYLDNVEITHATQPSRVPKTTAAKTTASATVAPAARKGCGVTTTR